MYLTRIVLDTRSKETARGLMRPNHFHANIENCFAGPRERRLWRIDKVNNNLYILIVSPTQTDFKSFTDKFSPREVAKSVETCDYTNFLNSIEEGKFYRFKLMANPVHSINRGESKRGERGKIAAHIGPQHQMNWLVKREQSMGVSFVEESLVISSERKVRFKNKGQQISLVQVAFEGVLKVEDADKVRQTLQDGIGRGKAYGCGMLTIMPA